MNHAQEALADAVRRIQQGKNIDYCTAGYREEPVEGRVTVVLRDGEAVLVYRENGSEWTAGKKELGWKAWIVLDAYARLLSRRRGYAANIEVLESIPDGGRVIAWDEVPEKGLPSYGITPWPVRETVSYWQRGGSLWRQINTHNVLTTQELAATTGRVECD